MLRSHKWVNNNARCIANSDETITLMQWRTVQHWILLNRWSPQQSTTTARNMICLQSHLLSAKTCEWMLHLRAVYRDDCTTIWILTPLWPGSFKRLVQKQTVRTWLWVDITPAPNALESCSMGGWRAIGDPVNNYISVVLLTLSDQMS